MPFYLLSGPRNPVTVKLMANEVATEGYLCKYDTTAGYVEVHTAGTKIAYGVYQETVTASGTNGVTECLVIPLEGGQEWLATTAANPTEALKGTIVETVTNAGTLDLSATTNPIFEYLQPLYPLTRNLVKGRFKMSAITAIES